MYRMTCREALPLPASAALPRQHIARAVRPQAASPEDALRAVGRGMTDVKTTSGAKRRGAPLDTTRAERGVWLVKVPQFLAAQWQSETPLTQERDGARSRVEPLLVAALVPVLKALHARGQLTLGWESVTKAPAFGALLTELEVAAAIPAGVLKPAAAPNGPRDAFAHLLPALHALVDAETRLVLSGGGKTCKQRLKEAARATLVPTGSGFAQASLGGAAAALLAQPAEARAASLADDDALARLVADASRAVALARVPQAQISSGAISAHLEAAEPLLGRVRMAFDPCAVPAAPAEFTLTLGGFASEGVPREYGLRRATEVPAMHIFGEPAITAGAAPGSSGNYAPLAGLPPGGVVSAEGVVERKFDVHLLDADDTEYRRLNRARMTAASTKTRVAKKVAEFATMIEPGDGALGGPRGRAMLEQAPLRVPLPARHNVLSKHALRGGAPAVEREVMATDVLQARLFELFESRSHWKIADLERATHQRLALLKQVLAGIAEMDRAPGPNRGAFQLLPHLRRATPPT